MLMTTVQLLFVSDYDTHIVIYTFTLKQDISLAREFQKHISNASSKKYVMDQKKYIEWSIKGSGMSMSIMFKTETV